MDRVGIRELRENLRRYLRRAAGGEAFEVTEFGRPLARLGPLPEGGTALTRLVEAGRATPARRSPGDLPPPAPLPGGAGLRSLDAIHIASAGLPGAELDGFVTYDARQAEAARAAGLAVLTPQEPVLSGSQG